MVNATASGAPSSTKNSRRWLALIGGLVLIAGGLISDVLSQQSTPGLGPLQIMLVALGSGVLLPVVLPARWVSGYARLACVAVSAYVGLVALELVLTALAPPQQLRNPLLSLRGFVQPSPWGGYELTPNWNGRFDDGRLSVSVVINAMGDRDDPPQAHRGVARRVLLLGDSFAFGWGLEHSATIGGQIEAQSRGEVAAYNLGVPGYGPEDVLERYRQRVDGESTHTYYLLFSNDLRYDNCRKGLSTAFRGQIVQHYRPDGAPFSEAELERRSVEAGRNPRGGWFDALKGVALLSQVRGRIAVLLDAERMLVSGRPEDFPPECAQAAARHAASMRALARERGQDFAVIITPTRGEARLKRYSQPMQRCVEELHRLGVPIVEVRDQLQPEDYFPHDEHFAPPGAHRIATAILAHLAAAGR